VEEDVGGIPTATGSSPSALPHSHLTAFRSPDLPGALLSIPEPAQPGHGANGNSGSVTPRQPYAEESSVQTAAPLSPAGLAQGFEASATSSNEGRGVRTNPDKQEYPWSPYSKQLPQSNTNVSPSAGTESPPRQALDREEERTRSMTDDSEGQQVGSSPMSSSVAPLVEDRHDINTPPNLDEVLAPGYHVPFIAPQSSLLLSEPNELPSEDFYPTNTMDVDWGSGDYLETMSFFNTDKDHYSLATKVLSDPFDMQDDTEIYDTSFPPRVGIWPSSMQPGYASPSSSLTTAYLPTAPPPSVHPSPLSSLTQTATPSTDAADVDWGDAFTIRPTDVLLPDMNSLEYYTSQLTKGGGISETGAEYGENVTEVSVDATVATPTADFATDAESSSELSGAGPRYESPTAVTTEETPELSNASEPFLDPSVVPSYILDPSSSSSSVWGGPVSTTGRSTHAFSVDTDTALAEGLQPSATPLLPEDLLSSSLTDVHWFVTESFDDGPITPVMTTATAFSPLPAEAAENHTALPTQPMTQDLFTSEQTANMTAVSAESWSHNATSAPPVTLGDQSVTDGGAGNRSTVTPEPRSSPVIPVSAATPGPSATNTPDRAATGTPAAAETSTSVGITAATSRETTAAPTTSRQFLCNADRAAYLTQTGKSVVNPPPQFVFRAVSGPVVYTAISVINALRRSGRRFLHVSPNSTTPDQKYQVHTVLQFVPGHIDVRHCSFFESVEKGLIMAFAEVRRRSKESTNFTVHILNITVAANNRAEQHLERQPVDITFAVSGSRGFLMGTKVSNALMKLTVVEFSYYIGFPVLQIAEPVHLLRSSWVRTVLLGVLDQKMSERTFQANMERRVAMLLGEATGQVRRVKRATAIGNSSVQVLSVSRLEGADNPAEMVYFVEGQNGRRMPAVQTADLLNSLDVQRAAIILGYRVQGILAQPVEKVVSSPPDAENTNTWIIIGVVVPLLVVVLIISILYWKLCRTDKLEFQPDAMSTIQQRQKVHPSIPPSIHPSRVCFLGRISPSDGDSVASDRSSERDSSEENPRPHATPSDGPPPINGAANEQLSSASIFEHVDRMSRSADASRRLPNKVQLIAMQPMPVPPLHSPPISSKPSDTNHMNKEIQAALRHKSEIEHHRNKIRLRAKRKGHYDFPAMDDMIGSLGDPKEQDRIYQKAQTQIDKILDPDNHVPSIFMESKKSGRGRRSPKQRLKEQLNGGLIEADKDHLITEDSDAVYRKCPGVNNVAYVRSPSPTDDVFLGPASSPPGHAPPPPPYMPPQPSIEEARQQMHSLLDDAFALVSPTSQSSTAGITLPGVNSNPQGTSPPGRGPRAWGPSYQALCPFPGDFLCFRQGLGSSYLPAGDAAGHSDPLHSDSLYSGRGLYAKELPSSARPRPVGGTTGAQLHHLTQVGLSSRMNGYPAGIRAAPGQNGGLGWNHHHNDHFSRVEAEKDAVSESCVWLFLFSETSFGNGEPTAPPAHLDTSAVAYLSAPQPVAASPPAHSSASLIKAIREELLRLSQKQAAVSGYHS
uniref:UPF0606 protein KIAA1549-like n=1 Tax=Fundulus heteroclitus TaxID=8078 RepID=A0A3Q2NWV2_FUNHE